MKSLGDQFLAGTPFTDDQHGPAHGRRTTGALDRVEKGAGLANVLIFPLHGQDIGIFTKGWQYPPQCRSSKTLKSTVFCGKSSLAHRLLNMGQHQFTSREDTMYNRKFFSTQLGKAALASIAMMTAFVALSSQITVTTPMPMVASIGHVEIA